MYVQYLPMLGNGYKEGLVCGSHRITTSIWFPHYTLSYVVNFPRYAR